MVVRRACFVGALLLALVLLAIKGTQVDALSKDQLYPYNLPGGATLQAAANGELESVEVPLKTPIAFYDNIYNSIIVNGNGVLSFVRTMQRFFNIAFPVDDPIIAPLYTHVDTRASGRVYYGESNSGDVLSRAGETVRRSFKDFQDFEPSHVFIVTWLDVGYYNEKSDHVNSYQVVISSNGTHSFVELLYPEGGIRWIQAIPQPNGLPDAKAQAGLMSGGKVYTLKGSGTDRIEYIEKWSNINEPGKWVFHVGPIAGDENIKIPDNIDEVAATNEAPSCQTDSTRCHTKAHCIDHEVGFCCVCKDGFFGNGKSCQPNDVPLRILGIMSGSINDVEFESRHLQSYVQTKDGRTYTALTNLPHPLESSFQLVGVMGEVIGWLFAKPIGDARNGYQLTGGVFNHTVNIFFERSGERLTIQTNYLGLDVFGQLKMEAQMRGNLPVLPENATILFEDYEELYMKTDSGKITSQSNRVYKFRDVSGDEYPFVTDQIITYQECDYAPHEPEENKVILKFSRGVINYDKTEVIVRFGLNTKIAYFGKDDLCVLEKDRCGEHSTCVVDAEGDDIKCICNPGYQSVYVGVNICEDIDECDTGRHFCSRDSICLNNEGSYICVCKEGYSFDGLACQKLPSCEDGECNEEESSLRPTEEVNRELSAIPIPNCLEDRCVCPPGYDFDSHAEICVPLTGYNHETMGPSGSQLPCDVVNTCHPYAQCLQVDYSGQYECVCNPGYEGDGLECIKPAECSGNSDCEEPETCNYNPENSRYECTCDPEICGSSTPDCSMNSSLCHPNAQCIPTDEGSHACTCITGYRGDGVRQCEREHLNCDFYERSCNPNAACVYLTHLNDYGCVCQEDYEGDGFNCYPKYTCARDPSICSPDASCVITANNVYACVCDDGFIGNGTQCRRIPKHDANILLVNQGMTIHRIPFVPSPSNPGTPIYIHYKQMAVAIDIDCISGIAYSSDISGSKISAFLYNGTLLETFLSDINGAEGLSVDWVARNIYWTDSIKKTVEVANLNTKKRKVLVDEGLMNPRGMAVHPYRGKIFWSDWYRAAPKLEWANADGTEREIFLRGEHVALPNSLSIDWATDELCWADAGQLAINCAQIDARTVRVVIAGLSYPFGLAISQNHYYWTDWKTPTVEVARKSSGLLSSPLSIPPGGTGKIYGIVAVPEVCPQVSNVCQYQDGGCNKEQLCLPDGKGGRTCACADDASGPCQDS
ncbi:nidogen-2 isoform X3 [Cephus cinctus]|uniref:Nidogen-2 isoform X3 n=1 Tax=Cephus cinctus TaxID=211228 RepID=A0AAJ7C8I6_CEPCN|nr:nidogen-2 isoform X3 [Cephus cinctus]